MSAKNRKKGRKIYTYRAKNRRMFHHSHPFRTAAGVFLTIAAAVILGIVGYSIVGPFMNRLSAEREHPTQTDSPFFNSSGEPNTTDSAEKNETTTSVASSATTAATAESTSETQTETTISTAAPVQKYPADLRVSCILTEETAADLKLLRSAAEMYAAKGYTEVLLPMKTAGGSLLYASEVTAAKKSGASADGPSLAEIVETVQSCGMQCSASVNLLDDQIYPAHYSEGAYQISDNRGRWLDRAESDGGKPWISPFSDAARKYLTDLIKELNDGGCQSVICSGLVFPRFRKNDIGLLGKKVTDADKQLAALTETLNKIAGSVPDAAVSISLSDAVSGSLPVQMTDDLKMNTVYVEIDPDAFRSSFTYDNVTYRPGKVTGAERVKVLLEAAAKIAGERTVIPCIRLSDADSANPDAVIAAAYDLGIRHLVLA